MNATTKILYCHCAQARVLPEAERQSVLEKLCAAGIEFEAVPDLCALAARHDVMLRTLARTGNLVVIACHPRAVRSLFAAAGAPLPEKDVTLLDLRAQPAAEVLRALSPGSAAPRDPVQLVRDLEQQTAEGAAWFPVVDFARCTHCMQCRSFCLFGVYGKDEDGKLTVQHPENCKPDCPACARVCPELAIIFPKYKQAPINGGEITAADAAREPVKVDVSALLGGDVYGALRRRCGCASQRFAPDRDAELARAERQRCLEQVQRDLDIPAEVLHSLVPPGAASSSERTKTL